MNPLRTNCDSLGNRRSIALSRAEKLYKIKYISTDYKNEELEKSPRRKQDCKEKHFTQRFSSIRLTRKLRCIDTFRNVHRKKLPTDFYYYLIEHSNKTGLTIAAISPCRFRFFRQAYLRNTKCANAHLQTFIIYPIMRS